MNSRYAKLFELTKMENKVVRSDGKAYLNFKNLQTNWEESVAPSMGYGFLATHQNDFIWVVQR